MVNRIPKTESSVSFLSFRVRDSAGLRVSVRVRFRVKIGCRVRISLVRNIN